MYIHVTDLHCWSSAVYDRDKSASGLKMLYTIRVICAVWNTDKSESGLITCTAGLLLPITVTTQLYQRSVLENLGLCDWPATLKSACGSVLLQLHMIV